MARILVDNPGPMNGRRGVFITFEGIEGAGKSTQVELLCRALRSLGTGFVSTREPGGGGTVGETLRQLLKDPAVWSTLELSEVFLYAAARAQHLEATILPALNDGMAVICDRYLDSTIAYQGFGRGRDLELIEALHRLPPLTLRPDRTLLFDLEPRLGLQRARQRAFDRHPGYDDQDERFFERVRTGFLQLAEREPERFVRLPAADEPLAVHRQVCRVLAPLFPGLVPLETLS